MADHDRSTDGDVVQSRQPKVLRTRGLFAEYNLGQRPTGEWFALGSVHSDTPIALRPAWVLVGTGQTAEDAVSGLLLELETEAQRLQLS